MDNQFKIKNQLITFVALCLSRTDPSRLLFGSLPTLSQALALSLQIAGVQYGGHVTDDWDRRVLYTYIGDMFKDEALDTTFYR